MKYKTKQKSWELFRSSLLNSTANPANFHPNWAGLTVLFSRQLLNGSQVFFFILIFSFYLFFKYKTIETLSRAFLPPSISALGSLHSLGTSCIKLHRIEKILLKIRERTSDAFYRKTHSLIQFCLEFRKIFCLYLLSHFLNDLTI